MFGGAIRDRETGVDLLHSSDRWAHRLRCSDSDKHSCTADSDRFSGGWERINGIAQPDAKCRADANEHSATHAYVNTVAAYTHASPDANPGAYTDTCANSDAGADPDAHANPDANAYSDTRANANPDAHTNTASGLGDRSRLLLQNGG